MAVEKKLAHEFLAIVDPQIRIVVEGAGIVGGKVHDVVSVVHQFRTHLR